MKPNNLDQQRIQYARKQVKKIRGFYIHLTVYIVVNLFVVGVNISNLDPGESYFQVQNFITFGFWGIGIVMHALTVFLPNFFLGSKWEERKIKEFMQKEDKQQQWD